MDPLYIAERASRERVWAGLLRLDAENRQKPPRELRVEGMRQPLSIVQVDQEGESGSSEILELCYRFVMGL
jgi:hypothetical protein